MKLGLIRAKSAPSERHLCKTYDKYPHMIPSGAKPIAITSNKYVAPLGLPGIRISLRYTDIGPLGLQRSSMSQRPLEPEMQKAGDYAKLRTSEIDTISYFLGFH